MSGACACAGVQTVNSDSSLPADPPCPSCRLVTCCAEKLKQAAVPLIDTRVCNTSDYNSRVLQHMVCAGYEEGGTDTCGVRALVHASACV